MITAVMIDNREPDWVKSLTFGGVPTAIVQLEAGDLHAVCDDGSVLVIERKTPDDLLNTLRDDRLLPQLSKLAEPRIVEQIIGAVTTWPYLLVTGELQCSAAGQVVTFPGRGQTSWSWAAVQGALLTVQEMGVFVVHCNGDTDLEKAVLRLGNRSRTELKLLPPRPPNVLGPGAAFLASLPGIGTERVMEIMSWAKNVPAHALIGLCDLDIQAPVGPAVRKKIRQVMGLRDTQDLSLDTNSADHEVLRIFERV